MMGKIQIEEFDPARNIEHRRWLERRMGFGVGDLDPDKPMGPFPGRPLLPKKDGAR